MPTRNVNLTDHFDRFIEKRVQSGRFSNASEVVREGLRLLEQREKEDKSKVDLLRAAVKKGFDEIDNGQGIEFDSIDALETYVRQLGKDVSSELARERKRV